MKKVCVFLFLLTSVHLCAQSVSISGTAKGYESNEIELFQIDDYISMRESRIATTKVDEEGRFSFAVDVAETRKLIIQSNKNIGYLYAQSGGVYEVNFPKSNKYSPTTSAGTEVEMTFFNLDTNDINYKVLRFNRWVDDFLGSSYRLISSDPVAFISRLERFRTNVKKVYEKDSLDVFFQTYVKFTIAKLDNIPSIAERNQYEKHDFYLKYSPVMYQNDAYMDYFNSFYNKLVSRLGSKMNNAFYQSVIKSSPTLAINALGKEYTLINLKIREMAMIKALSECYFSPDFPQTNILTMLDSLGNKCLFKENEVIAKNVKYRLTHLTAGSIAPDFVLSQSGKSTKTILAYRKKYLYLHFIRPDMESAMKELPLLKEIYERYGDEVEFVTVYDASVSAKEENIQALENLPWDVFATKKGNSIWSKYEVKSFPHYCLIDREGIVVDSPALAPTPNPLYKTIDFTFYQIKKRLTRERNR